MKLQSTHKPQRAFESNDYVIAEKPCLCQIKSEFHPLKTGHISKKISSRANTRILGIFGKC